MHNLRRFFPQPSIAIVTGACALIAIAAAWTFVPLQTHSGPLELQTILTLLLAAAILLTYNFPLHLRLGSKIYMSSVVYFLLACLLPLPLALSAGAIGCLAGELSVRSKTGNYPSDIATIVSRLVIVLLLTSIVAHLPVHGVEAHGVLFVAAAGIMWIGEHVSVPLIFYPITGERPATIVKTMVKEGGLIEGSELLIGLLGVYAARQEVWSLALLVLPTGLVYYSFKRAKEMDDGTRHTLESIADTVDLRDPYTGGHSRRVTEYAREILSSMGKVGPEVDLIIWAARVHDIGKVAIPDGVLNKPAALTDEERTVMESHSERGAEFLSRYPQFERGIEIVRHHHERWDGKGYPHKLRGTEIPFGARVIAVADSYDAMTSDRPYRRGMAPARAAAILREGRGTQWEGAIVDAFLRGIADQIDTDRPAGTGLRLVTLEDIPATAALA
jgi:putative nucleotidyltransferase with HDIG domain